MVPVAAAPVAGVAAGHLHHVDLVGLGEELECPVDRGQPDAGAAVAQHHVQLLGAVEAVHVVQEGHDGVPLAGVAADDRLLHVVHQASLAFLEGAAASGGGRPAGDMAGYGPWARCWSPAAPATSAATWCAGCSTPAARSGWRAGGPLRGRRRSPWCRWTIAAARASTPPRRASTRSSTAPPRSGAARSTSPGA